MTTRKSSGLPGVLSKVHETTVGRVLPQRSGKCYQYALWHVEGWNDWTLVHGQLTGFVVAVALTRNNVSRYNHAWAIKDDMVYEPLHNRIYSAEFYNSWAGPIVRATYTQEQAWEQMAKIQTYGPWHDEEPLRPLITEEQWAELARLNGANY